jgi:Protein of unknown function (DUF3027)
VAVTEEQRIALALAALREVTDPDGIGEVLAVEEVEPGVVDVRFASAMAAYTGWHWTVSTADLPDQEPTVLEVELLPGDGALLAPPWVPWAERLAEWRRQHPDERHPGEPGDESGDDENDDEDGELDEDDLAGDDGLDELDDADLEGEESPEEAEQDSGDVSDEDPDDDQDPDEVDDPDEDDDPDEVDRVRPALEDRSL